MFEAPPPPPAAFQVLKSVFGFEAFRGFQETVVGALCAGEDAAAVMPTGAGKSLCYQVPALVRDGTGLVISPLIALMHDQVRALKALGVRAATLTSADDAEAQAQVRRDFARGDLDLLYVSPERLALEGFREMIAREPLALVAIDEAHCVSEWGHDFRPEYRLIREVLDRLPGVPRIALTATADAATRADICANLGIPTERLAVAGFDRPNLFFRVTDRKGGEQIERLLQRFERECAIIYCRSRREVDDLAGRLRGAGVDALPYHAGLDARVRAANQERWAMAPGVVMVATVAFGMGVDKPDVRLVVHNGLPKSVESYYQEVGRAGRDGEPAECVTLQGAGDVARARAFLDEVEDPARRAVESARLDALIRVVETPGCRRVPLLKHFGDDPPERCGRCDNCVDPPKLTDMTEAARKLLSAVYRTGQRFGVAHLADVLRGKASDKVRQHGHDKLSVFGVGLELQPVGWATLARSLAAADALRREPEHGGLMLGPAARAILRGERPVAVAEARAATRQRRRDRGGGDVADDPLFERLRALRRELASDAGVPPYVIFHDAVLRAMAEARPGDLREMGRIPGIGQAKLKAYGDAFLRALADG